jgi:transcriptional regulator with XRE-family HTH domain
MRKDTLFVFGSRVRATRTNLAISQEDLASLTGLHRTYIGAIERGERNLGLINIVKLARALKISPSDLLVDFDSRTRK